MEMLVLDMMEDGGMMVYVVHFWSMFLMLSANCWSSVSSAAEMRALYVAPSPFTSFHTSRHSRFCSP